MSGTCSKIHFSLIAISRERDWLTDISWRYIKFDLIFLIGNLISNIFCSMQFFDKIHCLWDNEVFWVFQVFYWNGNKTILVEDTLNLIAHFRKEIRFCISFIRDTFSIWLTVYEIMRVFFKMAASLKWKFSFFQISRLELNLEQNMWTSEITFIKFSTSNNLCRFLIHCVV